MFFGIEDVTKVHLFSSTDVNGTAEFAYLASLADYYYLDSNDNHYVFCLANHDVSLAKQELQKSCTEVYPVPHYSVLLRYVDNGTEWHPIEPTGPFAVLTRGAFKTQADAQVWANEHIPGYEYEVKTFYTWELSSRVENPSNNVKGYLVMKWDYAELQNSTDKNYMLRFLPYLDTREIIGYEPAWVRRGYGYGRWEEFFHTETEARERMSFLIDSNAVEDIELKKKNPGPGICFHLLDDWKCPSNNE